MRAILIDPFAKTIEEVDHDGTLQGIYDLTKCGTITTVQVNISDALFLDDEGLFVPAAEQAYFIWAGSKQPFAGRGLIVGSDDEGESAPAKISLDTVRKCVSWVDNTTVNPEDYTGWHVRFF